MERLDIVREMTEVEAKVDLLFARLAELDKVYADLARGIVQKEKADALGLPAETFEI